MYSGVMAADYYLGGQQVNGGDVIFFLVHWQCWFLPRSCTGFPILCHRVLTLQTVKSFHFHTVCHWHITYTYTHLFNCYHLILFSPVHQFVLPAAWRRATPVSHQPSWAPGPEDPPQCCTRPWARTALPRGPGASGRCRSPPWREHTGLHSLYPPGHTDSIIGMTRQQWVHNVQNVKKRKSRRRSFFRGEKFCRVVASPVRAGGREQILLSNGLRIPPPGFPTWTSAAGSNHGENIIVCSFAGWAHACRYHWLQRQHQKAKFQVIKLENLQLMDR